MINDVDDGYLSNENFVEPHVNFFSKVDYNHFLLIIDRSSNMNRRAEMWQTFRRGWMNFWKLLEDHVRFTIVTTDTQLYMENITKSNETEEFWEKTMFPENLYSQQPEEELDVFEAIKSNMETVRKKSEF